MIKSMSTQVNELVKHKKEYVFGDKSLVQDVFAGLKMKMQMKLKAKKSSKVLDD